MSDLKSKVLNLYRKSLRLGRNWESKSGLKEDTEAERKYIVEEARSLFRRNQKVVYYFKKVWFVKVFCYRFQSLK